MRVIVLRIISGPLPRDFKSCLFAHVKTCSHPLPHNCLDRTEHERERHCAPRPTVTDLCKNFAYRRLSVFERKRILADIDVEPDR